VSSKSKRKSQMDSWLEESSSDEEFVDSDTEEDRRRADQAVTVTDTDQWLIQKLIRYIKVRSTSHTDWHNLGIVKNTILAITARRNVQCA